MNAVSSAEAISRLRHSLRTPLNHIVGYAEMIHDDIQERGGADGPALQEIRATAHYILEIVQSALPATNHVSEGAIFALREALQPPADRILAAAARFDAETQRQHTVDLQKIRTACGDLLEAAAGRPETEATLLSRTSELPARHSGPGGRILVVDDDGANREILSRRLEREGFVAASEAGGAAALERLQRENFDLVLLDLFMPEMDGFQVLAQIKSNPGLSAVPVVVLSALDDVENATRSIELGAEDFLAKPVNPVLLRSRIGAILRRRQVEAERTELAENLSLLLESTGEGIWGADREGRCTFINRAALNMLGYDREALIGRNLHNLLRHSRADSSPCAWEECAVYAVLHDGEPRRGRDDLLHRADGTGFPVEFSAYPIRRNGRTDGVVVTFENISERLRTEDHLLQAAKLESLGVLAGGIAHDFNNILTGILGNASLVLETLRGDDGNRELLDEVVRAGERAADLTRQMLAFAGKGRFVVEPMDLSAAVRDISELLQASLPKGVRLHLDLARDLPSVDADPGQMQQLVFNLVINAGEAIGERDGAVIVKTGTRELPEGAPAEPPFGRVDAGRYVYVEVRDSGTGMDAATRARIFEPFFSTKFTGRGLGLPAAMGIARAHRGLIRVESLPGNGSCFEVLLPAKTPRAKSGGWAGKTVLVVDDEEIVRRTTKAVLERKGFRVLLAENGQAAVEAMRAHADEVILILLDLTMPVMGGEEAARYLHAIRPEVPIVVSSGYNESEVARRFAGSRVAGFVRKPFTSATLLERIRAVLPSPNS